MYQKFKVKPVRFYLTLGNNTERDNCFSICPVSEYVLWRISVLQ